MDIRFASGPSATWRADCVVVMCFKDGEDRLPGADAVRALAPWLEGSAGLADFGGEAKKSAVLYGPPEASGEGTGAPRVALAGLGPREKLTVQALREAVASGLRSCRGVKAGAVGLLVAQLRTLAIDLAGERPLDVEQLVEEAALAALLGLYRFDAFKTKAENNGDEDGGLPETLLLFDEDEPGDELLAGLADGVGTATGVMLARDLVNTPSNTATPEYLAQAARTLAQRHGFAVDVLGPEECAQMGMGAFEAVFSGSSRNPARLIVLEHAPKGCEADKPLVFVGKGVTFDTGGISIKPSAGMEDMKGDMAGAAAVLGFFEALGALGESGIGRRIIGIAPCTENMPDGGAIKPGDIVTTLSGKTVEIINTDAEGRLLLCDALTHACSMDPAGVVDLATLTGACVVALGEQVGAIFANRQPLSDLIFDAAGGVGDRMWPLPLWDLYFETLKSDYADMKNVGTRWGGAANAALFLKQFVDEQTPWAHLDIAGPAYATKGGALTVPGGTGFGVRTLVELARRWEELDL